MNYADCKTDAPAVGSLALFAVGDRVRYVVSEGVVTKITRGNRCAVRWDKGPWAGKKKGFFDHTELHPANSVLNESSSD